MTPQPNITDDERAAIQTVIACMTASMAKDSQRAADIYNEVPREQRGEIVYVLNAMAVSGVLMIAMLTRRDPFEIIQEIAIAAADPDLEL